jgi:DNA-binding MarR family transcriptional regulator
MLPNEIFKCKLKPRDFTVLACLVKHSNSDYTCFPSYRTIAKECSISQKTVGQSLKILSSKRLIEISNRKRDDGSKSSNLYHIIFLNVEK